MQAKLVIITLLAAIGFFNFHNLIPHQLQKAGFMFMIMVCAYVGWKNNEVRLRDCNFPLGPWIILMAMMVVSIFMASFFHPQSLIDSAITMSTTIFAYGSFFVLLKLDADPSSVMKYMIWLLIPSAVVYVLNFMTIPNNMFGEPMIEDLSRGVLRVGIPLLQAVFLVLFYSINQWQITKRFYWIFLAASCFCLVLCSLTRQAIAFSAVLCFFQLLYKVKWYKKIILGVTLLSFGYFIFINLPMYEEMKNLTEEQIEMTASEEKEDVRIGAWRYYAYESNENTATWLFGNGSPSFGKSVWGKRFDAYAEESGYLMADVSWAGMIFVIGIIGTVALMLIVVMAIFKRKEFSESYLTYFMIFVFLRGIASGIFYYYEEIFITMIALYLLYRYRSVNTGNEMYKVGADNIAIHKTRFITE